MKERKTTDDEQPKTNEQNALWNGAVGQGWVASQELVDQLFRPIENLLMAALSPETTSRVLDVSCGTGDTTVAAARREGRAKGGAPRTSGRELTEQGIGYARFSAVLRRRGLI